MKFVRDGPPRALVERLAKVYLDNDTAIVPVLRALIASAEFAASTKAKMRDATEDVVGTWRALGAQVRRPRCAVGRQHAAVAGRQPRHDAVQVAAPRRRAARQRPVAHALADDRQLRHAPLHVERLVAQRRARHGLPQCQDVGARAARSGSTS